MKYFTKVTVERIPILQKNWLEFYEKFEIKVCNWVSVVHFKLAHSTGYIHFDLELNLIKLGLFVYSCSHMNNYEKFVQP